MVFSKHLNAMNYCHHVELYFRPLIVVVLFQLTIYKAPVPIINYIPFFQIHSQLVLEVELKSFTEKPWFGTYCTHNAWYPIFITWLQLNLVMLNYKEESKLSIIGGTNLSLLRTETKMFCSFFSFLFLQKKKEGSKRPPWGIS